MPDEPHATPPLSLADLGWSTFFQDQLGPSDAGLVPRRIATVHRARVTALSPEGAVRLGLPVGAATGDYGVGDWVLVDPRDEVVHRRLTRKTGLERRAQGSRAPQLMAANVDTLFIVTSCNADFNVARLERYLAFANQAGVTPVMLLTKADMAGGAEVFRTQAEALQRGLPVVDVNPRLDEASKTLAPWCGVGRTVALVGSSGVGKSTLVNTLTRPAEDAEQKTGTIREHDAKGRHTTTSRSIHAIAGGGWVIDTPGMRSLQISETADGIDTLFAEIVERAPACRFRDCTHAHEPGCAVQAAIAAGELDPERLRRWRKLSLENTSRAPPQKGSRRAGPSQESRRR